MALKLHINISTVIFDFKNIQIIEQGHYYASVKFYVQTQNAQYLIPPKEYEGISWTSSQVPVRTKNFNRNNLDEGINNGIRIKRAEYKTKGWNIKFTEEESILNEIVYSSGEIDLPVSDPDYDFSELRIPLMMDATLYFQSEDGQSSRTYEAVNHQTYRLGNITGGIHKFVPVEFSGGFTSVLNCYVQCNVSNLQCVKKSTMRQQFVKANNSGSSKNLCKIKTPEEIESQDLWMCMDYDECELLKSKKCDPTTLQPYLFPFVKRRMTTKKLASLSQLYYEKICSIFVIHHNRLRTSYKNLFNEMSKQKEEFKEVKAKFSEAKLEEDLFSMYDQENSDSDGERSDSDTSSNSSNSFSGSVSFDESEDESTDTSLKLTNQRETFRVNGEDYFKTADFGFNEECRLSFNQGLKHIILSKGASRGICLSPYTSVSIIEGKRDEITTKIDKIALEFLNLIKSHPFIAKKCLEAKYWEKLNKSIENRFIQDTNPYTIFYGGSKSKEEIKTKNQRKRYENFSRKETWRGLPFQNSYDSYNCPVMIEQELESELSDDSASDTSSDGQINEENQNDHLVFLLHGYKGKSEDMSNMRNSILKKYPETRVYSCKSMSGIDYNLCKNGILSLAKLVAREMRDEIERVQEMGRFGKISMIAHSLGGLVFRASLKYLKKWIDLDERLNMFITMGTPHCGYVHTSSSLLSTGMWFAEKFSKNPIISQIRLSDTKLIKDCFLYKLSGDINISCFSKIIFIGSFQDTYAPLESALVQYSSRLEKGSKSGTVIRIQDKILANISDNSFTRVKLDCLSQRKSTLDNYIGREAHIEFIDNVEVTKMVVSKYFA
ncbi:unnamed protein product [Moneuplotes crassus]|uniref:DUF676 domain-containing protein n=1 Tax=Euplotes crassus TaxID=5936 RepID=A0AAD1Y8N0_EUPCR|nr:unnamed protein product [Moneuplotes crassus]